MSLVFKRAEALLKIREAASREAQQQSKALFEALKKTLEGSLPCTCNFVGSKLTEDYGLEMTVNVVFGGYGKMLEGEQEAGSFLEDNCRALLGWRRLENTEYGYAAVLLF